MRPQGSGLQEYRNDDKHNDGETDDEDYDDDDDDESDEGSVCQNTVQTSSVNLRFTFPPKYPDEKPLIEVLDSQNLNEYELDRLSNNLEQKAQESIGTVMVFTLVSDIIEWLVTKSESEANELEVERERRQKEIEAEDKKRFDGTPVTVQTFLAWKAKFDAELLKAKLDQQKQQVEGTGARRLTGREMFESDRTLAESDLDFVEDLDQNQIEALLHNIEEVDLDDDDFDVDLELEDEGSDFEQEDSEESDS